MIDVDKDREATASIRGYFYQLDAALLEILSANLSDKFVIEGIEDLDLYGSDSIIYYQIKYYESQTLTNSTIRKPVHKMFMHFIRLDKANRPGRKYIIYGYFKEIKIPLKISSATAFRELMKYTTRPKDKPAVIKSLLDDVSADDQVVQAFCDAFEIRESLEFGEHRTRAINAVQKNQSVSKLEAEGFHYPRAANFIASLAIKSAHTLNVPRRCKLCRNISKGHRRFTITGYCARKKTRNMLAAGEKCTLKR